MRHTTERTNRGSKPAVLYAVGFTGLIVLGRTLAWFAPAARGLYFGLTLVMFACVLAAITVGVRRYQPEDRLTWQLVFVDQLLWLASYVVRFVEVEIRGGTSTPIGSAVLAVQYALLVPVMVRIVRARSGHDRAVDRAAWLDTTVVAAGAALLCWKFGIGRLPNTEFSSHTAWLYLFLALDFVLFVLGVRASIGRGYHCVSLKLVTTALFVLFAADTVYTWQRVQVVYSPHNFLDVAWALCLLLTGAAALHPSMVGLTGWSDVKPSRLTRGQLVAMGIACASAGGLLMLNALRDKDMTQLIVATCGVTMFVAVLARAQQSAGEDARANAALERHRASLQAALSALRATERERAELLESVMRAGENERMWVAAELHDGPIQQLAALGFRIDRVSRRLSAGAVEDAASALDHTRDELTEVVGGLRRLMSELRPPALDQRGIDGALRDYVAAFDKEAHVRCSLTTALVGKIPAEIETAVYRVAQEALNNVRKHAGATRVTVDLVETHGSLLLRVQDDGCGFEPKERVPSESAVNHYGLIGMRERVEQRGGVWRLHSCVGVGTTVEAQFPILEATDEVELGEGHLAVKGVLR